MKRKNKRPYHLRCQQCKRWFWAARATAMYCSGRCKVKAHRERHEDIAMLNRIEQMVRETNLGQMARKARQRHAASNPT